uniref:Uncharacterized protein n=1 Tax=Arundo donax TaxID=35708 RepID=A0A0A9GPH5_ARUDO
MVYCTYVTNRAELLCQSMSSWKSVIRSLEHKTQPTIWLLLIVFFLHFSPVFRPSLMVV